MRIKYLSKVLITLVLSGVLYFHFQAIAYSYSSFKLDNGLILCKVDPFGRINELKYNKSLLEVHWSENVIDKDWGWRSALGAAFGENEPLTVKWISDIKDIKVVHWDSINPPDPQSYKCAHSILRSPRLKIEIYTHLYPHKRYIDQTYWITNLTGPSFRLAYFQYMDPSHKENWTRVEYQTPRDSRFQMRRDLGSNVDSSPWGYCWRVGESCYTFRGVDTYVGFQGRGKGVDGNWQDMDAFHPDLAEDTVRAILHDSLNQIEQCTVLGDQAIGAKWDLGRLDYNQMVEVELRLEAVPEPCTMLLMGSGLAGLAGIARRRRRQQ
jgi:hypothetical protein